MFNLNPIQVAPLPNSTVVPYKQVIFITQSCSQEGDEPVGLIFDTWKPRMHFGNDKHVMIFNHMPYGRNTTPTQILNCVSTFPRFSKILLILQFQPNFLKILISKPRDAWYA